jgi:hypothetical protein
MRFGIWQMSIIGTLAAISAVEQLMEHGGGSDTFGDAVMSIVNVEFTTAITVKHNQRKQ